MVLFEREGPLAALAEAWTEASTGRGVLALVGGEAGAGKTSLMRAFLGHGVAHRRALVGACDSLSTPRPLGPLRDIAAAEPGFARLLESNPRREALFGAVLTELRRVQPTLLVIEDAHWADAATIDLLRFLARRVESTGALVVVTLRDDEVGAGHPLRIALGDVATSGALRRIGVQPLSVDAVRALAEGSGLDALELHRRTGGNAFFVTELAGHSDQVHGVAVSPDGKTIASASADGTIGLWSTATGKASHAPLKATEGGFSSVAFSPDGKYLATGEGGKTGSAGGQIVLWDVAGGYTPQVLAPGGGPWVDGLAFSHDGKTLAAATDDASGAVYSVAERKAVCPSIGKKVDESVFDAIALSPDSNEVAIGTGRGETEALSVWSTATCKQVGPAIDTGKLAGLGPNEGGWITSLAYSPDGKQLAVADGSSLLVLDAATRLPVRGATQVDPNYYIESLAYSPDGSRIALASKREIELLDASTGKPVGSQLLGPRGSALSVAFGADGHSMAAGSSSGDVEVYDLQNEPLTARVPAGTTSVSAIAFSPDGKVLASAGAGGVISLWNTTTWQIIGQTTTDGGAVPPLAFSPDGKVLASVGGDKLIKRMDGTLPVSTELAVSKAYTAAVLRMPTHQVGELAQPGAAPVRNSATPHNGRIILFGGGYPLCIGDVIVGAIGVSGGSVEQDMLVAQAAVKLFQDVQRWASEMKELLPHIMPSSSAQQLVVKDSLMRVLAGAAPGRYPETRYPL